MHADESRLDHAPAALRLAVGTLWTLERHSHVARCALVWLPGAWELRILIDDEALLAKRCRRQDDVVATAQEWRRNLRERGWQEAPAGGPLESPA